MSRGHRLLFPNQILFFFEDRFVLSNSVDPDEMPYNAGSSLFDKVKQELVIHFTNSSREINIIYTEQK